MHGISPNCIVFMFLRYNIIKLFREVIAECLTTFDAWFQKASQSSWAKRPDSKLMSIMQFDTYLKDAIHELFLLTQLVAISCILRKIKSLQIDNVIRLLKLDIM